MNRYERKRKTQQKMKKLHDDNVYFITHKSDKESGEEYYQRLYLSGCRKLAKKRTNRIIRNSKNDFNLRGCAYRRKFDYWWTLF